VDGGRKPIARIEATLGDLGPEDRQRFASDDFLDRWARPPPTWPA
jgi:hypothetical protein